MNMDDVEVRDLAYRLVKAMEELSRSFKSLERLVALDMEMRHELSNNELEDSNEK